MFNLLVSIAIYNKVNSHPSTTKWEFSLMGSTLVRQVLDSYDSFYHVKFGLQNFSSYLFNLEMKQVQFFYPVT